jgi:hypothetical protein
MIGRNELKHPSYGRVVVTKPSGGNIKLFGSGVNHLNCVSMTVETARMEQDVHGDWIFRDKTIVEFYMSEAQWAHMLSSFGDGSGTPVTLRFTQEYGHIEQPPEIPTVVDIQRKAVDDEVRKLASQMKTIEEALETVVKQPTVKKKDLDGIRHNLNVLHSHFISNLPYYEKATIERMEKEVGKAKIEIDAILQNYVHKLGLKALAEGHATETLQLPESVVK